MTGFKFLKIIFILGIFFVFSTFIAKSFNNADFSDKIVFIPIKGVIVSGENGGLLDEETSHSSDIIDYLDKANSDSTIKGIILEIDSPGGTAIGSKEVADAVKNIDKPVVAWIRSTGASGAYWVASATDSIIADQLSIVGSIGVIGSYLEFADLMEKYGVKYEKLVGGKYKDLGTPYRHLTSEEKDILQKKIDLIHEMFKEDVSKNRNMDLSSVSNGEFFLGIEAQKVGLVDYLGDKATVINITKELANIKHAKIVAFKHKKSLLSSLDKYFSKYSYLIGLGISNGIFAKTNENEIMT